MVFYFTPIDPSYLIYMGSDKQENELLIKYGFPEDVWFHVEDLSSAHVYLRLNKGQTINDIPNAVLEDCLQLVKANSILGVKQSTVNVVYTPWSNLKKTNDMDVGQVSFFSNKSVITVRNVKKNTVILNRLNKTKRESGPDLDLAQERSHYDQSVQQEKKAQMIVQKKKEKEEREEKTKQQELRSYTSLMNTANMTSNKESYDLEEDFM